MKIQNTDMEFITFDAQDVIATSGGLSLSGHGDGIKNNIEFLYAGETYRDYGSLSEKLGKDKLSVVLYFPDTDGEWDLHSIDNIFMSDANEGRRGNEDDYNGNGSYVHQWLAEKGISAWVHQ